MHRFLAALLGLLLCPLFLPAGEDLPRSLRDYALKSQGRSAYGMYVAGKRVGWQIEEYKVIPHDGKDVLQFLAESHFAVNVDGEKSLTIEKSVTLYELEGEGKILQASSRSLADKTTTQRLVVRKDGGLLMTTTQGKRTATRSLPLTKDCLARERAFEAWLRAGPGKGEQFKKCTVSWEDRDVDVEETYTYKEKRTATVEGRRVEAHAVTLTAKGAAEEAVLLSDGRTVTSTLGPITLRLEKEEEAKKLDGGAVDIMAAISLEAGTDLGKARRVTKLTLELTGLGDFDLPQSPRQKLKRDKKTATLELLRDFRVEKAEPLGKAEMENYLEATPAIQSDHEAIRAQARKVVGKESDPLKAATLLERWVYRTVRKSYSDNADTALAVLDNKAGDCTEHALLFVALARSVGIPAREVGGLAYSGGEKPTFAWHAWAEIHDGRQWVTIDPTWNEVFVDATHIKLSEGADNLAWINLIGKLRLRVVRFEKE